MNRGQLDNVLSLVNTKILDMGYECIEAEWEGREKILRIYIDKPGGVFLSDCVEVNTVLKDCSALDDMVIGEYNLEISSPGMNRPLRLAKHFKCVIGEKVTLKLNVEGAKKAITGKLLDVTSNGDVVLETESGNKEISLQHLQKANVIFNWNQD